jgi:hypothetical protein
MLTCRREAILDVYNLTQGGLLKTDYSAAVEAAPAA